MIHYCTSFNETYLIRGITLYQSLAQHSSQPFTLWVLCFDDRSYDILQQLSLPNFKPVPLTALEADDSAMLVAKSNRSTVEYFFTCSPLLPLYLFKHNSSIEQITYLDSDLFFFADPQPIFDEMGSASILIIPHRFPPHLKHLEESGIYNVGLLSFRKDKNALACLHWWRERCLEWCYDLHEDGKFADQKYLDDWTTRFSGVHVLQHKGANLAPWNVMNYHLQQHNSKIYVDDEPLIFFHYQGVKIINSLIYDPGLFQYGIKDTKVKRLIYPHYIHELTNTRKWAKQRVPDLKPMFSGINSRAYGLKTFIYRLIHRHLMFSITK